MSCAYAENFRRIIDIDSTKHFSVVGWSGNACNIDLYGLFSQTCGASGTSYTYRQGRRLGHGFARALVGRLGLSRGDVVAIVAPNVPEFAFAAHGAIEAGLTVTFVNPLYTAGKIEVLVSRPGPGRGTGQAPSSLVLRPFCLCRGDRPPAADVQRAPHRDGARDAAAGAGRRQGPTAAQRHRRAGLRGQ